MNWSIRHQGSPISINDLTLPQIVEGLQDGQWEPTDEVKGPDDLDWVAIENHPQLAEIAEDLEPPALPEHDDETRLDMNALIDVTLVLLIFFILTTSYAALQKILEAPTVTVDKETGVAKITQEQVREFMIHVTVTMAGDRPVIRVEGKEVEVEDLLPALRAFTYSKQRKTDLLIECHPDVPRETVVAIQDKAKGANVQKLYRLVK